MKTKHIGNGHTAIASCTWNVENQAWNPVITIKRLGKVIKTITMHFMNFVGEDGAIQFAELNINNCVR